MDKQVKTIKNDMRESIYQIGEDLRFSVSVYRTEYRKREGNTPNEHHFGTAETDCIELKLLSDSGEILYDIKQKGHKDAYIETGDGRTSYDASWYVAEKKVDDMRMKIAEELYKDHSDKALVVKNIMLQIKGHPLLEEIKQNMSNIHKREVERYREEELKELNNNKLARLRKKTARFADKITEKLGMESVVQRFADGKKIEDVKIISKPMKEIEKALSDKLFGKVKE